MRSERPYFVDRIQQSAQFDIMIQDCSATHNAEIDSECAEYNRQAYERNQFKL